MKTSNQLLSCILILALSYFSQLAKAQIVYTDVNPDQTYSSGNYNLDLNNDGTNDFTLTLTKQAVTFSCHPPGCSGNVTTSNNTLKIKTLTNNKVATNGFRLDQNTLIDSALSWSKNTETMVKTEFYSAHCFNYHCVPTGTSSGDWLNGATDKYLGLRIQVNSQIYYGWVRLDVSGGAAFFTIKEYAYNSIPDQSILAGEGQACASPLISASGTLTFCKGSAVTLYADNMATQFQWNKNGTAITGAIYSSYTASDSGTYTCNLTNSCGTIISDSSVVTVNEIPKATITPWGAVGMCAGNTTNLSANTGNNLAYQWKKNKVNISGATNSTLAVTLAGDYKVRVTNTITGCSKTSDRTSVTITCKEGEVLNDEKLSVSPNPFSRSTVISFQLAMDANVTLKIFDMEGRLIRTLANADQSGVLAAGTHELTWNSMDENGNAVSAGIYFLKMETAGESKTISLSVVK